jgi:hypothetical protein
MLLASASKFPQSNLRSDITYNGSINQLFYESCGNIMEYFLAIDTSRQYLNRSELRALIDDKLKHIRSVVKSLSNDQPRLILKLDAILMNLRSNITIFTETALNEKNTNGVDFESLVQLHNFLGAQEGRDHHLSDHVRNVFYTITSSLFSPDNILMERMYDKISQATIHLSQNTTPSSTSLFFTLKCPLLFDQVIPVEFEEQSRTHLSKFVCPEVSSTSMDIIADNSIIELSEKICSICLTSYIGLLITHQ